MLVFNTIGTHILMTTSGSMHTHGMRTHPNQNAGEERTITPSPQISDPSGPPGNSW